MIEELETVVLTEDLREYDLRAGDLGTVVLVHRGGEAYEIEFMTLDGDPIEVVTLLASQIRLVREGEIAHARLVAAA